MTEEIIFDDGQKVIVDSIGVSHFFLPPKRCKNCDDWPVERDLCELALQLLHDCRVELVSSAVGYSNGLGHVR